MLERFDYSPENQSGQAADLSVSEANTLARETKEPSAGSFKGLQPIVAPPSAPNTGSPSIASGTGTATAKKRQR